MLTLFGNLESGNVHKVAMLLTRLERAYRRVDVAQTRGEPRRPEFLATNPIGKIPALLFDDGDCLSESGAILFFLAQGTPLWPVDARARAEVLRWMFFEQYSHEPTLAVMRYLRRFAPRRDERTAARARELEPSAHAALRAMEQRLAAQPWIAADACTIADFALYPYTRRADEAGVDVAGYPAIVRWLERFESQPRFLPFGAEGAVESVSFAEYYGVRGGS